MSEQTRSPFTQRVLAYLHSVIAPTMTPGRYYYVGYFPPRAYVLGADGTICRGDLRERGPWGPWEAFGPRAVVRSDGSLAEDAYGLRLQRQFIHDVSGLRTSIGHEQRTDPKIETADPRRTDRATRRLQAAAAEFASRETIRF